MGKRISNQLPADIVQEILLKLPLKSVLRFKSISKLWRSSIRSKVFIKEHPNKSNSGKEFTHHNLIFTYNQTRRRDSFESCCIRSLLNDDDYVPIPSLGTNLSSTPIPSFDDNYIDLLGSCNGLLLIIINWRGLYLWNPSTRKAKRILTPQDTIRSKRVRWPDFSKYMFGYDQSTDDYKVVCLLYPLDMDRTEIHMYSLRTDSWKKTRYVEEGPVPLPSAKFLNGRLHWFKRSAKEDDRCIVSLDCVGEEKCQIMDPPQYFSGYCVTSLEDLGGYLCFICHNRRINIMDVWVMKNEAWSSILTCSFDYFGYCPKPLWLKKNGDIVVALESDVIIYRGNNKLCQSSVHMFNHRKVSVFYVESLVSPFGDDDEEWPSSK